MAGIDIGTTIYQLRKRQGFTQEQLARMIGVSAGAISKWETGSSTPDVALLAPLARALHSSLDELFSFRQNLSDDQLAALKQELAECFMKDGYEAGEQRAKFYLLEYPQDDVLKLTIANMLQMYVGFIPDLDEEKLERQAQEILRLNSTVDEAAMEPYASAALFQKAFLYLQLDELEKAEQALEQLAMRSLDASLLSVLLLQKQGKWQETRKMSQGLLLQALEKCSALLSILAEEAERQGQDDMALRYLQDAEAIQSTFATGLGSMHYRLCRFHLKRGCLEAAAAAFAAYVQAIVEMPLGYQDSPYFSSLRLQLDESAQRMSRAKLLEAILEENECQALAHLDEYQRSLLKAKDALACWQKI